MLKVRFDKERINLKLNKKASKFLFLIFANDLGNDE